jgi:hypothetical protein
MDLPMIQHDLEMIRFDLNTIDTLQALMASQRHPEHLAEHCQTIHECSFSARACIDKVLGALGLSDGTVRLSDIDRARAGLPANE